MRVQSSHCCYSVKKGHFFFNNRDNLKREIFFLVRYVLQAVENCRHVWNEINYPTFNFILLFNF